MRLRPRRRGAGLDEIEIVYRERAAGFHRVAAAVTGDEQLGADAVHDGFVLAVCNRARFRGDGSLEAWLWRIVVNEARKRRAERARFSSVELTELTDRPSRNGDESHDAVALLAALPERQRLALFLRYYADLDYAAIAEALRVKPGTVAATLNAAHTTLRKQLEEVQT